jgi:hypothetical protein
MLNTLKVLLISLITPITFANFSTIDFTVEKTTQTDSGLDQYVWTIESDDPRPLLYLVTYKTENPDPKNCDDGWVMYDTRDVLRLKSGTILSQTQPTFVQLCALTLQGFVYKRIIVKF